MSELDPIRAPKGRKWLTSLIVGVVTFMGMLMSAQWWMGAEVWKLLVAGVVSVAAGVALAWLIAANVAPRRK